MSNPNKRLILVAGDSSSGKSASLRNLRDPEGVMYLNFEHKDLPFGFEDGEFEMQDIYDIEELYEALDFVKDNSDDYHTVVFDTATFMLDMINRECVQDVADTQKGWANYQNLIKDLMQNYVGQLEQTCIFLAHTLQQLNPNTGEMEAKVPIQGALKNNGFEAFFSLVVHTKTVPVRKLEKLKTKLLNVNEAEDITGIKYVYQVNKTKETANDRIRSPMGMFPITEPYMDNDVQMLSDALEMFYFEGKRNITEID